MEQDEQNNIKATIALNKQQAVVQKLKDDKPSKAGKDPDIQALRDIESAFAQVNAAKSQIVGHGLTAVEGAAFWAQYLSTFKEGSEQVKHVLEEFVKYQEEIHKSIQSAMNKQDPKSAKDDETKANESVIKEQSTWIKEQGEDLMHTGERWKEYNAEVAKSVEIAAQSAANIKLATIAQELADGNIKKTAADYQIAGVHAKEYADKLAELDIELKKIAADQSLTPAQKATQTQGAERRLS